MRKLFVYLMLGLLLAGSSTLTAQVRKVALATAPIPASKPADAEPAPAYIIKPNDLLDIFVWKEAELTRKVLVRPDGRISFPLIQDLPAAGATPTALKQEIEKRLLEYIPAPNVTVIVDAIQSYRVFVTGKVQKPGSVQAEKPITVLQALAMSGGFLEFANLSEITIVRDDGADHAVFRFNYSDVTKGKNPQDNFLLRNGDVVVVP
jgi:polysaccharide export outer membrane protein